MKRSARRLARPIPARYRIASAFILLTLAAVWFYRTPDQSIALAAHPARAVRLAEAMDRLPAVGSVLLTGAHPDDENNPLLAYLARGLQLRTAYLSATRGDGGQNLLGSEQYEALGIVRTEELVAARNLDGAGQFFSQAYDFGFSKSQPETFEKWGREAVLSDFVRIIRRFRPDILISRFSGTPRDGHGHHQAAGTLTIEAFRAVGDPNRFPEHFAQGLKPWQPLRLYSNRGRPGQPVAASSLTITLGGYSPLYGEQLGDLGMLARSQHRSQGMGRGGSRGVYTTSLQPVDSVLPPMTSTDNPFEGVDLTLTRFTTMAGDAPEVATRVARLQQVIELARAALSPFEPATVVAPLARGLRLVRELRDEFADSALLANVKDQAGFLLEQKEMDFQRAIALAGITRFEAEADCGEIVPGTSFQVAVATVPGAGDLIRLGPPTLTGPPGWTIEPLSPPGSSSADVRFRVTVPEDALLSQPYWLVEPRTKDYFPATSDPWVGDPANLPLLRASLPITLAGSGQSLSFDWSQEVVYRSVDRVYGEKEKPLFVIPAVGVWVEPASLVFPSGTPVSRSVRVQLRNNRAGAQSGAVRLQLPAGWRSSPTSQTISLDGAGDEATARFEVSAPAADLRGNHEASEFRAVATFGGKQFSTGYQVIDYPHIQTRYLFRPAEASLLRVNVAVAPDLKIGYIMGSGDEIPTALQQMGVDVTLLSPDDLASGDLAPYNVILTGIRAFEVRRDLAPAFPRLLEYVNDGGYLIVQYSRRGGFGSPLGPYPFDLGSGPRVSVEEAPIRLLQPAHPLFHFPNEITPADFDGWIQERGTYFMESWSPEYTPLMASNDPGEPSRDGGMLVARYGEGLFAYTGYVWFRQLPAGVPGALRIFANLVSLANAPAP